MSAHRETPPKLYGDGVHDDTDAVQWYLDRGLECRREGASYRVDLTRLRFPPGMALVRLPASSKDASEARLSRRR